MTGVYDLNPMPHKLHVRCPSCDSCAEFEFAEVVKITLKKDIEFFQGNDLFDYRIFPNWEGRRWHGAIYYAGLHGGGVNAIRDLPDGYRPEDWSHSKHYLGTGDLLHSYGLDLGSTYCLKCHTSGKHELSWPKEAYFSIEYRGKVLWAFHRESTVELRDYIASSQRRISDFAWESFLLHIPSEFKHKSARDQVVKKLNKLLRETAL